MSAFYFGPLGQMTPLRVSVGVQQDTGRAFSEFISSGGVRYVQQGRAAPRTWQVGRQWQEPGWVRLLSLAAHGLIPDAWLYDVAAARQNMVPARLSAGTGASVLVDGLPMGGLPVGHTVRVPVLGGRTYSVACWADTTEQVFTYQHGDQDPAMVYGFNGTAVASFTPVEDTIVTVKISRAGASGLRVHEGYFDARFHAGHGTPCRVAVQDPGTVLQMVTDQTRTDYTVTLMEVGKPGHV